jgi:hypothetical protein
MSRGGGEGRRSNCKRERAVREGRSIKKKSLLRGFLQKAIVRFPFFG